MKPSHSINMTGNPEWRYVPEKSTDVAATMRRWLKRYCDDWGAAQLENAERDGAVQNVRPMKKVTRS